jgi:hypothetical protein
MSRQLLAKVLDEAEQYFRTFSLLCQTLIFPRSVQNNLRIASGVGVGADEDSHRLGVPNLALRTKSANRRTTDNASPLQS